MKTPFTPYFEQANLPLPAVSRRPFIPQYALPFVSPACTAHFACTDALISYRWHDAFDVFVALLEVRTTVGISIPVESHLSDLYLMYQLQGESRFVPDGAQHPKASVVAMSEGQRMEVYTPPARAVMEILPSAAGRYAMAAIVPKSGWVTRHPLQGESPMEELIQHLKRQYNAHHYLHPSPISPAMHAWLHVLLTTPPYVDMRLDDALNGPMVRLLEEHRNEYRIEAVDQETDLAFIEAARLLGRELITRMGSGPPPTAKSVAEALHTTERRVRAMHYRHYNQRFDHYLFACRIEEAKELLQSDLPVSATAYQLGWKDHTNFSHEFKRHTGMTPTEYRSRCKRGV